MTIAENIKIIMNNVAAISQKSGRGELPVVAAVTKTRNAAEINEAINAGITVISENKAQELSAKYADIALSPEISVHFIGHLQTNKIKYIIDKVDMVESLDSFHLANALDEACRQKGRTLDVLIQINIGNEPQKHGFAVSELFEATEMIEKLDTLKLRGLMAILPLDADVSMQRKYFSKMYQLFLDMRAKKEDNNIINILSMGMSGDYETAIECGATLIRLGTAVFGARNYNTN